MFKGKKEYIFKIGVYLKVIVFCLSIVTHNLRKIQGIL